jgi:hypothetical protein
MKNSILNTDIFNVIITNCIIVRPYSAWAGPPCGAVQLEKWPDPVTSRDSAALSGHSAVLGRATDMKEQDAEGVNRMPRASDRHVPIAWKKWSRLEKNGRGWKKMDITSSKFEVYLFTTLAYHFIIQVHLFRVITQGPQAWPGAKPPLVATLPFQCAASVLGGLGLSPSLLSQC